ncbi:MAG: hypothetical protein AB7U20_23695 [Planctomycetaceae bacterium]
MSRISDIGSMNDPELQDLERRLKAVSLSPNPPARERLLYACGRAAGRAEVGRRLRAMYVAAASLACVSAGLFLVLLSGPDSPADRPNQTPRSVVERQPESVRMNHRIQEPDEVEQGGRGRLTVGSKYEELMAIDQAQLSDTAVADAADEPSHRVLTPLGLPGAADLWN